MGKIRIGLSGWNYEGWRGDFYPGPLRQSDELAYVGDRFPTVEVNSTFYGLLRPATFSRWYACVPPGFVFALKGSRFITHNKKLANVDAALANFFASGILELDDKLGPILWQLSQHFHFDAQLLDGFLERLPTDTHAAAALARRHDERIEDVGYGPGAQHRIRHVIEVRHSSWLCAEMAGIARRRGVALAFSHSSQWPYTEEITAGFVYVRLHGPGRLYASAYGEAALRSWADRLGRWHEAAEPDDADRITSRRAPARKARDVYVYFDNDESGYAPREAAMLRQMVGGKE